MNNKIRAKVGENYYYIDTDFRTAIKCQQIATDSEIDDNERAFAIIYTLYGEKGLETPKDFEKLLELGLKYLSFGQEIKNNEEPDMDFIQDYDYIKASFRSDYGINLDKEEMSWKEFYSLLNGLSNSEFGNCCILNRIRNLRTFDLSEIKDNKTRDRIVKAQKEVALKKPKTYKQKELDEYWDKILGGD